MGRSGERRGEAIEKLEGSRYAEEVKELILEAGGNSYLEGECRGVEDKSTLARFRMGNEARGRQYWRKEEERMCRLCNKEVETYKHIFVECAVSGNREDRVGDILAGDRKSLARLKRVKWLRKSKEKEEGNGI